MQPMVFLHNIDEQEAQLWLQNLKLALATEDIYLASQLSKEKAASVEVAIVANPDPSELASFPNLVWVQSLWAGVESIVESFKRVNAQRSGNAIELVRLIDPQLATTMAEAVLAWTLYLHRQMPEYAQQQRDKQWRQLQCPTADKITVSVLGTGELGQAAIQALLKQGYQVNSWSRSVKEIEAVQGFVGLEQLPQMLAQTEILVCLLPLTEETKGLLCKDTFQALPKGAKVINFARGPIINHEDLINALDNQQLAHAVLDVFETEPLPVSDKLWQHPHVTILPHISAMTNVETATQVVAQNITHYHQSGELPVTVDLARGY
mgnify:CR=1 FL=1